MLSENRQPLSTKLNHIFHLIIIVRFVTVASTPLWQKETERTEMEIGMDMRRGFRELCQFIIYTTEQICDKICIGHELGLPRVNCDNGKIEELFPCPQSIKFQRQAEVFCWTFDFQISN